jgi:hypothetical protein
VKDAKVERHRLSADIEGKTHMGDFSRWQDHTSYQKAFQRLLRDLQGAESDEGR